MKLEWKTCFRVGISAFLLFLGIYYWGSVTKWAWLILGAAGPLLIGVIIAYVLNILMSYYERLYFPNSKKKGIIKSRRVICLVLSIVTMLGIVAAVLGLVVPELVASVQLLIKLALDWLPGALEDLSENQSLAELIPAGVWEALESINWKDLIGKAVQAVTDGIGGAVGTVAGVITSVFSTAVTVLVAVIFSVYLLISKDNLLSEGNRLMKVYLKPNLRGQVHHVFDVLNDCFHRYVVGQCVEAVILGVLCMIGMFIFRFPYATMIGTLVGFTALIPIAGAYIGAVVGAFMILTVSPLQAVLFVIYLTVLQQLEGNLIYPRVVGSSLGLPGMWVLAAVTVGGGLFGILGMLIGVPLAAAAYRLLKE
ncbi:MAG: AI-2E family transporter, partial [Lachnospiraceae bacterium]|nr:AI-2E family transporter [Lachnospiraceae bacterium]